MSQVQPLSTLAPEYSNQLQPIKEIAPTQIVVTELIIEPECAKAVECPKEECIIDQCTKDPCAKDPCVKDPCKTGYDMGYGWGWLGALIL